MMADISIPPEVQEHECKISLPLNHFYLLSQNKEDILHYETTNADIIEIKNDILIPKMEGVTRIDIYDEHNNKEKSIEFTLIPKLVDSFDKMRQLWRDMLLGDRYYDSSDLLMLAIQKRMDSNTKKLWQTMNKNKNRENLWSETIALTSSANLTTTYRNLKVLATAVMNEHSSYYLNKELLIDTLSGLEWMRLNKYNADINTYGNWWDWEIGIPRAINDILIMLYPILSEDEISTYLADIDHFVPDPNCMRCSVNPSLKTEATAANQVDISKVKILQNVLRKHGKGVEYAKEALKKILLFVTEGEGFYADGSFLQHKNVPYTGSYGNVLLDGVSQLFTVIQPTEYAIVGEEIRNIFTWINDSYAPLIYKGNMMDMVRGRAISRGTQQSSKVAIEVIQAIVRIAEFSTQEEAAKYKKMVKQWILQNETCNYVEHLTNYRDISLAKKILADPFDADEITENMFKNYAMMDRVVYKNAKKDFALGISMSSNRIKRYEAMNNENIQGWHTGDGMLYLYNNDLSHFNDDFWATVDPYRLSGITVEQVQREHGSGSDVSTPDFVGGLILDNHTGIVAMHFINYGAVVSGYKSWAIFDDHVVAMGSGIKNTGSNNVETIIENRKLNDKMQYKLYVNDEEIDTMNPLENEINNVTNIYLEAADSTQSIGYHFITPQKLTIKIENRQGTWNDINKGQSSKPITRKYLTIWKTHEKDMDEYDYVIYPAISREAFGLIKLPTLLQNNENIQAVKNNNGKLGVSIFAPGNYEVEDMIFTQPMILSRKETNETIDIAVADPTMLQVTPYIIQLPDKNYKIMTKDENIEAIFENDVWQIIIDPANKQGQNSKISFTKEQMDNYIPT